LATAADRIEKKMGACNGKSDDSKKKAEEKKANMKVDNALKAEQQAENSVNKLLLLGAGESGKSTLFKQMMTIYGTGFSVQDRMEFKPIIHNNIIVSIKTLLKAAAVSGGPAVGCVESKDTIEQLSDDEPISQALANHIKTLWEDEGVRYAYDNRCEDHLKVFHVTDSANYFFDALMRTAESDYIPTTDDVMRSRVRTTGIVENDFTISTNQFKMYDVGGQRNERKKWIHCFENVTAVLFVGVLSEYNLVLYEDDSVNRMEETLNLFDEIINSRWFRETDIILFLNKRDLFEEKIKKYPLTHQLLNSLKPKNQDPDKVTHRLLEDEFEDDINDYELGKVAIHDLFIARNLNAAKHIYAHYTCATDTNNITAVFDAVKDIIIRNSLSEAGLV